MKKKATLTILAANLILYIIMEIFGGSTHTGVLVYFGAMFKPLVQMGEWWRFFTPIFLHIGFSHLLMNSYSLFILGQSFETLYGSVKFIIIYLFSGIMGNLMTFGLGNDMTVSAGASTSIYGLFGLGIAIMVFYREDKLLQEFSRSFVILLVINLVYSFTIPGIDMLGHLGGLLGGIFLGGVFPIVNRSLQKYSQIIGAILYLLVAGFLFAKGMNII